MDANTNPHPKILVVEDDARWTAGLLGMGGAFTFARDLTSALGLIDRRRKWAGAIFDRYLLEGDVPFSATSIRNDAGFVLAAEFLRRFPESRVCIVSGDPELKTVHPPLLKLLDIKNCRFIFKGRHQSQALAVSFILSGKGKDSLLDSVLSFLVLEPNFFGLGVNLNEIIERLRPRKHR